jgi:GDP-4-dehydro-6-deoxy-D-mannose reductase
VTRTPLVTGATGFAGSHLVEHLLEREHHVPGWGNPGGRPLPSDGASGRVAWTSVDITDVNAIAEALAAVRPSAVYHCAGIADVHSGWTDSARALSVNALGTHALLTALERLGLRVPVLVTGSALVYRASTDALTEESALGPSNPYGVSKLAQEMATRDAQTPVLLARPFNHAGPRQSSSYVTSSFARQIAEAEAGLREAVLLVGNLDARRDITDVRDTVRAYRLLVERGQPGRPYNICCGVAYRIGDLLERLMRRARIAIEVRLDPTRLRPSDNPVVLGSPARIQAETGWEPRIPIEQTLDDLLDYWRRVVKEARNDIAADM